MSARDREPAWARLDVDYLRNRKVSSLPDTALILHLELILWCKEQGTEGSVPGHYARVAGMRIGTAQARRKALATLVAAGLLHEEPDGYTLAGFDERNGSGSARLSAREYERDRKREQRKVPNVP